MADATLEFIDTQVKAVKANEANAQDLSSRLLIVMLAWELLHSYIKPVADAGTLRVPYPLVQFISDQVGRLEHVKNAHIVIELMPQLNYFQHPHTSLRETLTFLRQIVGLSPEMHKLGFLGLPCSQSKGLFMNCLLYHEAGHFIAEEAGVFATAKLDELKGEFASFGQHDEWAANIVLMWMEEIFADLVAVKLLGPAYTLAYMELQRSAYALEPSRARTFDPEHPADAMRFREQLKALRADKWKSHVPPRCWSEMERIAKSKQYLPPEEDDQDMSSLWSTLMTTLLKPKRIAKIHQLADEFVEGRQNPRVDYAKAKRLVRTCLEHGIVPSVSKEEKSAPEPTAIINGAVLHWLRGMKPLYAIIPKLNRETIEHRAILEQRVEMWSTKAIADWLASRALT